MMHRGTLDGRDVHHFIVLSSSLHVSPGGPVDLWFRAVDDSLNIGQSTFERFSSESSELWGAWRSEGDVLRPVLLLGLSSKWPTWQKRIRKGLLRKGRSSSVLVYIAHVSFVCESSMNQHAAKPTAWSKLHSN